MFASIARVQPWFANLQGIHGIRCSSDTFELGSDVNTSKALIASINVNPSIKYIVSASISSIFLVHRAHTKLNQDWTDPGRRLQIHW